jgi:hypothetical protein
MSYIGIKVGLDAGDLYANSAMAVSAIKEIDRAMAEASKKGDVDLAGRRPMKKSK